MRYLGTLKGARLGKVLLTSEFYVSASLVPGSIIDLDIYGTRAKVSSLHRPEKSSQIANKTKQNVLQCMDTDTLSVNYKSLCCNISPLY